MTRTWVGRAALALVLHAAVTAFVLSPVAAQDPPSPDPAPGDTLIVPIPPEVLPPDTIPGRPDPPADTVPPPRRLPTPERLTPPGWAHATWEWDQQELGRWHGLTVLELIERIPGLVVTRAGWYGQPTGVAAYGHGGGRFRIFFNGFEFDGLASATPDLQHVSVVDLASVRVEVGLLETRVYIDTFAITEGRPFSQIEASTGVYGTRFIRGLFSTVLGTQGTITVGLDVTDTRGWVGEQPFTANAIIARYSRLLGARSEMELEYRQVSLDRPRGAFALQADRGDLVLRGRYLPLPALSAFGVLGRSWRTGTGADTLGVDLASLQASVGAEYAPWRRGSLRGFVSMRDGGRTGYAQPTLDANLEGVFSPLAWADLTGQLRHTRTDGISGAELLATVRVGPAAGFSAFATAASGTRGIGLARDTLLTRMVAGEDGEPILEDYRVFSFPVVGSSTTGVRTGLEWSGAGARLGVAHVIQDVDSVVPFGLPFDRTVAPAAPVRLSGFEVFGSIPIFTPALRIEGTYSYWGDVGFRPYLPEQSGRGALVFSRTYYEGNLEPTLRVETIRRGSSLVPDPGRTAFAAVSQPYDWTNLFLQIRILDVRAFFVWENVMNNLLAQDLPGLPLGGQRFYYGVRWHFLD
jgi:hypothetical protein